MAIALPILILLVFGLFEFTRIYMIQQLMQNVAREGCRNAVIQGSINAKVLDEITQTLDRYGIRGATANLYVNNSNTDISNAVTNDQVSVQILVSSPAISIVPNGFFYAQLSAKATRRKH